MSKRAVLLVAAFLLAASGGMVQAGVGVRFVPEEALPEAGARLISTF